jgi:hypothetical protein
MGEFLEVPEGATEDELVDLILFGLSQVIQENKLRPVDSETRIAKIAYDVSKNLDLPITRSWYKYGSYVWAGPTKKVNRLNQMLGLIQPEFPDPQILIRKANTIWKVLHQRIKEEIFKHRLIQERNLSDFLMDLYRKEAPKEYRNIYINHRKMTSHFERLSTVDNTQLFIYPALRTASDDVTSFHRTMIDFPAPKELRELVIDFSTFLEDLIVQHDALLDDRNGLIRWQQFFSRAYDCYSQKIWAYPASIIALQTVNGPSEKSVKNKCTEYLAGIKKDQLIVSDWVEDAFTNQVYPTKGSIELSQQLLSKSGEPPHKAELKELFTRMAVAKPRR